MTRVYKVYAIAIGGLVAIESQAGSLALYGKR